MSHLVETMAYLEDFDAGESGSKPWHGLGNILKRGCSPKEAQRIAGANFSVTKEAEYIRVDGTEIPTGKYQLVRSDITGPEALLSSVSNDWNPVQPDTAFEFFDDFCTEGDMEMNTAGVFDNGRMMWVLAKVKESFSLFKGKDVVDSYLLFSNPLKYGYSTTVMGTPIRVVCNNTLQLALSGKTDMMIRINHRREFDPELVKKTLFLNKKKIEVYKEAAEFLASKKAKPAAAQEYFAELFPLTSNKKDKEYSRNATLLMDILEKQPGAELGAGTWWQAFNAVTFATDHLIGNNDNTRLYSAFYGTGRNRKVDALTLATKYAKV